MDECKITVGTLIEDLSECDPDMPIWAMTRNAAGEMCLAQANIIQFMESGIYLGNTGMLVEEPIFLAE